MIYGVKTPCFNCEERKVRCHSSCSKYQDFKNDNDKRVMKRLIETGIVDSRRIEYEHSRRAARNS